jgi:predicted MarR family transcription regulator
MKKAEKSKVEESHVMTSDIDRRWHLARTDQEINLAELEYALLRTFEAFNRWQAECFSAVIDFPVTGQENALLHIIRMNDRPKSLKTLAQLTNRDDIPNMQYSLRKLIKSGLVERTGTGRSGVTYMVTKFGHEVTEKYAKVRGLQLAGFFKAIPDIGERLQQSAETLNLLVGIYEQAGRILATHRHGSGIQLPHDITAKAGDED